jgi:hypothetical protein
VPCRFHTDIEIIVKVADDRVERSSWTLNRQIEVNGWSWGWVTDLAMLSRNFSHVDVALKAQNLIAE